MVKNAVKYNFYAVFMGLFNKRGKQLVRSLKVVIIGCYARVKRSILVCAVGFLKNMAAAINNLSDVGVYMLIVLCVIFMIAW